VFSLSILASVIAARMILAPFPAARISVRITVVPFSITRLFLVFKIVNPQAIALGRAQTLAGSRAGKGGTIR
jgi:CBS domain containing-hemolysin-like protein